MAKNLFFGEIVEENLFPYPKMRERDREMLVAMTDAIDAFLADKHADFKAWDRAPNSRPSSSRACATWACSA